LKVAAVAANFPNFATFDSEVKVLVVDDNDGDENDAGKECSNNDIAHLGSQVVLSCCILACSFTSITF
jgi:hypothetical protein